MGMSKHDVMREFAVDRERRIAAIVGRGGEDMERVVLAKGLHDMFYQSGRQIAPPYEQVKWPDNVRWEMMAVMAQEIIAWQAARAKARDED